MTTKIKLHLLLLVLLHVPVALHAQGTAFNYQGRLVDNGGAANGTYDFVFTLYDAQVAGNALGAPQAVGALSITAGQFVTPLDFGPNIFTGEPRWLQIDVRVTGAAAYTTLAPRQALLPTPYAIYAASAGGVASGTLTANQLNTGGTLPVSGQFLSYNGGNLVWSDPAVASGSIWSLNGLNTYFNTGKVGIGTLAPATPLEVNGILRSTRNNISGQYIQLDGGDPAGIRLTANSVLSAEKTLSIQNFSGEAVPGVNNNIQFVLGTAAAPSTKVLITKDGNVGMGSLNPVGKLEVVAQDALRLIGYQPFLTLFDSNAGYARGRIQVASGDLNLFTESYMSGANPFSFLKLANNGNVGIGSTTPQAKLEIFSQDALRLVGYQPFLTLLDSNAGNARGRIQGVNGDIVLEPESFVNGSNPSSSMTIAGSGNVSVKSLTIRGGADLAEPFPIKEETLEKGSVVVIDDEHPGRLKRSTHAYDTHVAGVISGANGIHPGISLKQEHVLDSGENVALTGRVYVRADASGGGIKPGDLLTTSSTAGQAMKVTDFTRAQGAILGKAMSALPTGQGMVLVLVTLQ
jgi:hypothetical protein